MKTKTVARREAILAAAKAVFEEAGFEQATMSEITAKVGGSKATLYRYFDSKEALFLELVHRSAKEHGGQLMSLLVPGGALPEPGMPPEAVGIFDLLQPDEDVATALKRFGIRMLEVLHTPQKLAMWRMIIAAAASDPEMGRLFYENGPALGIKQMAYYFEGVMRAGKLRQADANVMCAHFRGLLKSEVDEPGLFNIRASLSEEEIVLIVGRAVDAFMRAYGT